MDPSDDRQHLHLGAIIFPGLDQFDFAGPFEVLSRVPNSTFHLLWKDLTPVKIEVLRTAPTPVPSPAPAATGAPLP